MWLHLEMGPGRRSLGWGPHPIGLVSLWEEEMPELSSPSCTEERPCSFWKECPVPETGRLPWRGSSRPPSAFCHVAEKKQNIPQTAEERGHMVEMQTSTFLPSQMKRQNYPSLERKKTFSLFSSVLGCGIVAALSSWPAGELVRVGIS